jgi:hypothetical protein
VQLPPSPATGRPIEASWGKQVVDYLRSITPGPSAGGIKVNTTANGTTFALESKAGGVTAAASTHCWQVRDVSAAAQGKIQIEWGQFRDARATNEGVPVNVVGSGVAYASVGYSVSSEGVLSLSDLTLAAAASVPASTGSVLYVPIAAYEVLTTEGVASVVLIQGVRTPLWAEVCLPNFVNVWAL